MRNDGEGAQEPERVPEDARAAQAQTDKARQAGPAGEQGQAAEGLTGRPTDNASSGRPDEVVGADARASHAPFDVDDVLSRMTLREKCEILVGADGWHTKGCVRLGVPPIMMCDGPNGLRKQSAGSDAMGFMMSEPATCFPTESALACSFDEDLVERVGTALGQECRAAGASVLLGPGVNMKRSPLCGRNFEYYSEDPVLAGWLAAAHIRGVQGQGVGVSLKHFLCNSQEKARMTSDSVVAERALHELYARAFSIAVRKARPWTVMSAYNRVNGVYCSENEGLLRGMLRQGWGFKGAVVTDWSGLSSVRDSLPAGLDLVMPGPRRDYPDAVERRVREGEVPQTVLDEAVRRVLELTRKAVCGQRTSFSCDLAAHARLAQEAAERSAVLLKNEDGVLPVADDESVAVIGAFAKHPRFQGTGSSRVNPVVLDDFVDAMAEARTHARVAYAPGYDPATGAGTSGQLRTAHDLAAQCDVAVVFLGLPEASESEGFDRSTMRMPDGQVELLERVCAANPRTVVVLVGGAPVETQWRRLPKAVVLAYLAGCQGGHAMADLVTGRANPSGKLAETWPERLDDTPTAGRFPDPSREVLYTEDLYTGYRYYDAVGARVAFPFGFGLSYTTFAYEGLEVHALDGAAAPSEEGGADDWMDEALFDVACTVRNTGGRDGREAVQWYVAPVQTGEAGPYRPPQQLQAFKSVPVAAGEAVRVSAPITRRAFSVYSPEEGCWRPVAGDYEVRVSASSRDVRLAARVHVEGDAPVPDGAPERYHRPTPGCFSASAGQGAVDDFKRLYGRPLPAPAPLRPYTLDSTLSDTAESRVGRLFYPLVMRLLQNAIPDERIRERYASMIQDMPIKSVQMQGFSLNAANVMVRVLNGEYGRAAALWWSKRVDDLAARAKKGPHGVGKAGLR